MPTLTPQPSGWTEVHAIVVFGAALNLSGEPGPSLTARLRCALARSQRYPMAMIVVSGGAVGHSTAEADAMAAWLTNRGVVKRRIVRESVARHTLDNAERVAPILVAMGATAIELVTECFHMPRSYALMHGALVARGVQVELRPAPAPDARADPDRAEREAKKRARDLRSQAALHGTVARIPFGGHREVRPVPCEPRPTGGESSSA